MRLRPLLGALAALLMSPGVSRGQAVSGHLTDASGAAVPAARVILVDSGGVRVGSSLTDASGGFRLQAPRPGRYRVMAERVGFASTTSTPLELRPGADARLHLRASSASVSLEGITARGGGARCRLARESGQATAALWDEARKALDATAGARENLSARFVMVEYRRELDAGSLAITSERRTQRRTSAPSPFVSSPLDTLLQRGFVRASGDSVSWDAPDAEVLLSPRFQASHCLHTVAHPDSAGLIGLGFRPVGRPRVADVAGTLWLDRASAQLRFIEFRYVHAGDPARHPQVGGRVDFQRLSTGHWIVRKWWIRLPRVNPDAVLPPRLASGVRRPPVAVPRLLEVGGEVMEAGAAARGTVRGDIAGTVWDSVASAPLAGAEVSAVGTPWVAYTDSAGRFVLPAMAEGVYRVTFRHSRQLAGGLQPIPAVVTVPGDSAARVGLATRGVQALVQAHCPRLQTGEGLLAGRVAAEGVGVSGATVSAQWSGLAPDRRTVTQPRVTTQSGPEGSFVICGVPREVRLELTVRAGSRTDRRELNLRGAPLLLVPVELDAR
jgi:hypothetical protein